ncbi:alpha/beta hydrolase family protein [Bacteroides caecicola]|uniref:alpha/beta hydrolase family protein n=1 Tax=Bacteroides caecicola TaxID=1462569 RepID=UPI002011EBAC|nr:alpha/beta hydrolase [Bacteroides caecicola]MCL1626105.1 alpha/beta hydrolase [Bacteroides caecicola]
MKNTLLWILVALMYPTISYAQEITGTWHGKLNAGRQQLEIIFHFGKTDDGKNSCKMDIPEQGARNIPVNLSQLTKSSVSLEIPAINLAYSATLENDTLKGTFKQNGMTLPLNLISGEAKKANRPQEPKEPFDYKTEEVTFTNAADNATLAGTLTYPTEYTEGKQVPVVLMVTGSGAQNRNEELFEHKPFLVIADYLAKQGIASLRYDDRGVGKSTGNPSACTSADFANDAKAGLAWLRSSKKFGKVGILGHSEGGMIAFMIGADKEADFIVSMAGSAIKGDTLIAEQQNAILRINGMPANRTVEQVREEIAAKPKNAWLDYFLNYDPTTAIAKITIPVMAINGSHDMQVLPTSNLTVIKGLLKSKNEKNFFKEYPELNHLFQHCKLNNALDYYKIEETCSPEVLSDIANWINSL